jgi:hypothetical protein
MSLALVAIGLTVAAVGCSSSSDDGASGAATTTDAVQAVDMATWSDAVAAAASFDASLTGLTGEISILWDDLYARFDAISTSVRDGDPSAAATTEWAAFRSDTDRLGTAIDADTVQLGTGVVDAWNRFAAALDVLDARF